MINIVEKRDCCGCEACVQACPKHCISFVEDVEGFLYPAVDKVSCIGCGLCEKVCPILNQAKERTPLNVYAAKNQNEQELLKSSSGGIFILLAKAVVLSGGVVFGAKYDEKWNVIHAYAETEGAIKDFMGSKYVQSRIGNTYKKAKVFLEEGRPVLFSGTSCQIVALKRFLRREYDNLLTVDVVCHGVPSPKVWRSYLEHINPQHKTITYVNMRDKSRGWSRYSYVFKSNENSLYDDYAANSIYLKGFINNLFLRPSCFTCPAKKGKVNSDITLGDCWGYEYMCKEMFDDKGLSTIVCHTTKGEKSLMELKINLKEIDYGLFAKANPSYSSSSKYNKYCFMFWELFPKWGINAVSIVQKKNRSCVLRRLYRSIKHILLK